MKNETNKTLTDLDSRHSNLPRKEWLFPLYFGLAMYLYVSEHKQTVGHKEKLIQTKE